MSNAKDPKEYDTGDLLLILAVRHLDAPDVIEMMAALRIHFGEERALDAAKVMARIATAHKESGPLLYSALAALQEKPPTAEQRLSSIEKHTARLEGRSASTPEENDFFLRVRTIFQSARAAANPGDTCMCIACQLRRAFVGPDTAPEPAVPDHKAN